MIILLIVYLVILPLVMGACLETDGKVIKAYFHGVMLLLGFFGMCYYILLFGFRSNSLKTLCIMYHIALLPIAIYGFHSWRCFFLKNSKNQELFELWKNNSLLLFILAVVVGIQLFRVVFLQVNQPRDNVTYNPLICQIVESRLIYAPPGAIEFNPMQLIGIYGKYITTPWYVFEACLASMFHVHSLVVAETIIPLFVLVVTYICLTLFGQAFFQDSKSVIRFVLFCVLLYEAGLVLAEQSDYMLIWPMWGKNIVANIICPAVAWGFVELVYTNNNTMRKKISLMLIVFVGTVASAATMMAVPVELGGLALAYSIKQKRWFPIYIAIIGVIPCLFEFVLYYSYERGLWNSWLLGA